MATPLLPSCESGLKRSFDGLQAVFKLMAIIYLGALLDNTQYDIEVEDDGRVLTQNPVWCEVKIESKNILRINLGSVATQQLHCFNIAFGNQIMTYQLIGMPNIYL